MNFDRKLAEADRQVKILRLANLLIKRYHKIGSMTVMLHDGSTLTDRPALYADWCQYERNIKSKAEELARLAIDSPPRPITWRNDYDPRTSCQ